MVNKFHVLRPWGWNEYFEREFQLYLSQRARPEEALPARVIGEEKGFLRIVSTDGSILWARFRKKEKIVPAVGDWIVGNPMPGTDRILFEYLLPRKSWLSRREAGKDLQAQVIAANLDTVFIVSSLNNDYNPKRIERYIALALDGKVRPVVVLSKADLVERTEEFVEGVRSIKSDIDIIPFSLFHNIGIDHLKKYLVEGETIALVGSSGVGKSSIVNFLLKSETQKISDVRDDDKGRHTTTSRILFQIPDSSCCIVDTPGMREVGLWIQADGLQELHRDIEKLALACRFRDCEHEQEPGCALKLAVEKGELSQERYEHYMKMRREAAFSLRQDKPGINLQIKKKWKRLTKALKARHKQKRRD